jgi:hypothetical protein
VNCLVDHHFAKVEFLVLFLSAAVPDVLCDHGTCFVIHAVPLPIHEASRLVRGGGIVIVVVKCGHV